MAPRGSLWLLVPPSGGPCWIPNATLVLLYGHSSATLLPLSRHSPATLLPFYCHSTTTLLCHSSATLPTTLLCHPLLCHSTTTPLLFYCYPTATLLPFYCHSFATLLPLLGHSTGTLLPLTSNLGPRQPKSYPTHPRPRGPRCSAKYPQVPLSHSLSAKTTQHAGGGLGKRTKKKCDTNCR